jgi:hypothetical protein
MWFSYDKIGKKNLEWKLLPPNKKCVAVMNDYNS